MKTFKDYLEMVAGSEEHKAYIRRLRAEQDAKKVNKECRECGASIEDPESEFCTECGSRLVQKTAVRREASSEVTSDEKEKEKMRQREILLKERQYSADRVKR